MSSVNSAWSEPLNWAEKPFTYRYSQPREYHYSLDSIEFMWRLGRALKHQPSSKKLRILDLCAGCGVLGFELNHWIPELIDSIDFVEIQPEYEAHFMENLSITGSNDSNFRFNLLNFKQVATEQRFQKYFDLIVCNPPYFRPQTSSLSKSQFRNRCHFLLDASFSDLCSAICESLSAQGQAYVLIRDLREQGIDQIADMMVNVGPKFSVEKIANVRGTAVVRIAHNELAQSAVNS